MRPAAENAASATAAEWEELAERVGASPFARPGWVEAWAAAFGRGRLEPACVRRADGRLAALLALEASTGALRSPTNWHSPAGALLSESPAATRALFDDLVARGARRLALAFLDVDSADLLCEAARGARVLRRTLQRSPYVALSGSWEKYERARSPELRAELRRLARRLSGRMRIDVDAGGTDLDARLEQGFAVEAAGWKGERGTAVRSRAATRRFYGEIARWAAARGWLRLAFLHVDGRPAAFDLCLEQGGVHYLLKTGYDPAFAALSPGKVLRHAMLERAFRAGLRSYELLGESEPWKLRWTSTTRARELVQVFRSSPAGLVDWTIQAYGRPLARRVRALARASGSASSPASSPASSNRASPEEARP